jgi:membrane protease YdiL (CAAX protease family)
MSPLNLTEKLALNQATGSSLLAIGFMLAIALRVAIGGVGVAHSAVAGLAFGAVLIVLCAIYRLSITVSWVSWKILATGIAGAALLLVVPSFEKITGPVGGHPAGNYAAWALVITFVALAEEAFLRGVFFDAVARWRGETAAVVAAAILFAALHIPLYGWHVVPLDFVVGIWLGSLRLIAKSWVAPGIAHTLADLASWWLV